MRQHPNPAHLTEIRVIVFSRGRGLCELCGFRPASDHHHCGYKDNWGREIPQLMLATCRTCHMKIHGRWQWDLWGSGFDDMAPPIIDAPPLVPWLNEWAADLLTGLVHT